MSIPSGSTKVVIAGTLGSGEIFETGFWVTGADITTNVEAAGFATAVVGIMDSASTSKTAVLARISGACSYDSVRVYHYTGGPTAAFIGSADFSGWTGTGTVVLPDQVCMVVSLRTTQSGRRYRGRMYMPCTASVLQSNSQFGNGDVAAVATAWKTFLDGVNGAGIVSDVVIVSQTGSFTTPVSEVRVDTKPDIQRRRANKIQPADTAVRALA